MMNMNTMMNKINKELDEVQQLCDKATITKEDSVVNGLILSKGSELFKNEGVIVADSFFNEKNISEIILKKANHEELIYLKALGRLNEIKDKIESISLLMLSQSEAEEFCKAIERANYLIKRCNEIARLIDLRSVQLKYAAHTKRPGLISTRGNILTELYTKLADLTNHIENREFDGEYDYTFFSNDIDDLDYFVLSCSFVEIEADFYKDNTLTKKVMHDLDKITKEEVEMIKSKVEYIKYLHEAAKTYYLKEIRFMLDDDFDKLEEIMNTKDTLKTADFAIELIENKSKMIQDAMRDKQVGVVS